MKRAGRTAPCPFPWATTNQKLVELLAPAQALDDVVRARHAERGVEARPAELPVRRARSPLLCVDGGRTLRDRRGRERVTDLAFSYILRRGTRLMLDGITAVHGHEREAAVHHGADGVALRDARDADTS